MKKATLAELGILTAAGCGPLFPQRVNWGFDMSPLPDTGRVGAAEGQVSDDAWAERGFALYGEAAVQTCLGAFHHDVVSGNAALGMRGNRAAVAGFRCDCARGQSAEVCPAP